ncbi:MAG: hypothetical protein HUU04_05990 [Verrucomicrobiae bacterium]|nr:hypothetical protein [Verrucomicrobiae bacterium]
MKLIRQHPVFLAILAAFLLLFGGSVAFFVKAMRTRSAAQVELDAWRERRAALWARKPFPKQPNVEIVQRNAREMKAVAEDCLARLRGPVIETPNLGELDAKGKILVARRQMSEALVKAEVKHPEKFQFGFDRYTSYPPKKEHIPLLLRQNAITAELVRLLAAARIFDLLAIRRVEFEDVADGAKAAGGYDPKAEPLISQNGKFEFVNQPNYLYSAMPFDLEFICDTEALRRFLTDLSRSPYIFIPRIVTVENEKKEPLSAPSARSGGAEVAPAFTPSFPTPAFRGGVKPPAESASTAAFVDPTAIRPVMGEERIKVGIRLDWLDFRHADAVKAGATERSPKGKKGGR